jgi:hypothetical protein
MLIILLARDDLLRGRSTYCFSGLSFLEQVKMWLLRVLEQQNREGSCKI